MGFFTTNKTRHFSYWGRAYLANRAMALDIDTDNWFIAFYSFVMQVPSSTGRMDHKAIKVSGLWNAAPLSVRGGGLSLEVKSNGPSRVEISGVAGKKMLYNTCKQFAQKFVSFRK